MPPRWLLLLAMVLGASGTFIQQLEEARSKIRKGRRTSDVSSPLTSGLRTPHSPQEMGPRPLPQLPELPGLVVDVLVSEESLHGSKLSDSC